MDCKPCAISLNQNVPSKLFERFSNAKRQFDKAVDQIRVLDLQMRDLETRYRRAVKNKKNSFHYNLRLKLSVVTGIKMMYNHFATKKEEEIRYYTQWLEKLYNYEAQNYDPSAPGSPGSPEENDQQSASVHEEDNADDSLPASSPASSVFSQSTDDCSSDDTV